MEHNFNYYYLDDNVSKLERNRPIQLKPLSFSNIKKHFIANARLKEANKELEQDRSELTKLEERKIEVGKSKYMIEHGSMELVEQKIAKIQKEIEFLEVEKQYLQQSQGRKPLKLIPKMFANTKKISEFIRMKLKSKDQVVAATPKREEMPVVADFPKRDVERISSVLNERLSALNSNNETMEVTPSRETPFEEIENNEHVRRFPADHPVKLDLNTENELVEKPIKLPTEEQLLSQIQTPASTLNMNSISSTLLNKEPEITSSVADPEVEAVKANVMKLLKKQEESAQNIENARRAHEEARKKSQASSELKQRCIDELTQLTKQAQNTINQNMKEEQKLNSETNALNNQVAKENQEINQLNEMLQLLHGSNQQEDKTKTM